MEKPSLDLRPFYIYTPAMGLSFALEKEITRSVKTALDEDVGDGDISAALIPASVQATGGIVCFEDAVMCGRPWADEAFAQVDPSISVQWLAEDGDLIEANQRLCNIEGPAASILTAERVALNFVQLLMGTATTSRRYAQAVKDYSVQILDTRKTIPGLRYAQKYAVATGGCSNHRFGLFDAYLIKENHIAACGSIAKAVATAKANQPDATVEVEVESLNELSQALEANSDIIMLDNFSYDDILEAVVVTDGRAKLEVSGNVELSHLAELAKTGVDFISTGSLTKHARAIDLSLRLDPLGV